MKKFLVACVLFFGFINADEYEFVGKHYVASYKHCNPVALKDINRLKEKMVEACFASGATVLETSDFIFEPDGMTMVLLLSESHASIHTYPEHDACFIDLFTCGTTCSAEKFSAVLKEYLSPTEINEDTFHRD